MSGPTLVCFAVPQEAKPFLKAIRNRVDVRVLVTGMGARNADRVVREIFDRFRPARVFTCGFAGALNPSLRIGDVIFDAKNTPDRIGSALRKAGARPATFHCAERVAILKTEKFDLREKTGADVVEMESAIVHQLCAARKVECITVRAISDIADADLPLDFNVLMTANEQLSAARLALAVLKSPQKIPALMGLGSDSALAARRLAAALVAVLDSRGEPGDHGETISMR